ncbi:MAG: hypothetical protein HY785_05455 [Oscillatoriophycideae cyanobacterium NC_groundwater_1537_Pr4_S-0.65um_50_18]|nr:hypothetical protein [Oscillatoriophycideae cyanobacterium NC_groundwater_1537_Pr4_S-0.65um_50_18]
MTIEGTSGNDILRGLDQEQHTYDGDVISGHGGDDQIFAGTGYDWVYGGSGNDIISGEAADDLLFGNEGNDIINGGLGNDEVIGDSGRDALVGGVGEDLLVGGFGSDFFIFNNLFADGIDKIGDFEITRDYIVVDINFAGYANTGLIPNTNITADQFRQGTAAIDANDRFIYDSTTGNLFFDPDGIGSTAQTQIATLNWQPTIGYHHIYAYQDRLPTRQIPGNANNPALLHGEWTITSSGTTAYMFNPNGTYASDTTTAGQVGVNFKVTTVGRYTVDANGVITMTPVQETTKQFNGGVYSTQVKTRGLATEHKLWVHGEGARGKYILLDDAVLVNGTYQPKEPDSKPSTYELTGGFRDIVLPGSVTPPDQGTRGGKGTSGNDRLTGTAAKDTLLGLDGNDKLTGSGDNDILRGGKGNDQLWGGTGNDVLKGDRGRDIFALESGVGRDLIKDFSDRQDKLGLTSGLSFKDLKIIQRGGSILVSAGNDQLATISGVRVNQITAADFSHM